VDEKQKDLQQPVADISSVLRPGMKAEDLLDAVLNSRDIIPWEPVALPSQGAYYKGEKGEPLMPDGMVQVRPMGIFADKALATARLAQSGKSLDWLFRKCVKLPEGFDPLDLIIGDRIFLLYYLRGITHGPEYEFIVKCNNADCGKSSEQFYNLSDLIRTVVPPNESLGQEPFKVPLPYMSKVTKQEFYVGVRLLRGKDTQDIITRRNFQNMIKPRVARPKSDVDQLNIGGVNETLDETVSKNLQLVIVHVMGIPDRSKIEKFVEQMHSEDTATVREFLRENSPGIDTQLVITCPHCGIETTVDMPITESFFRPSRKRRTGQ
jgi:hypothetical protein